MALTKKEIIAIAEENNIFYRASWKKEQIQKNINKKIKKGSLVDVICARSGLTFQLKLEKERSGLVHPKIADWLNSKNYDVRYPAIEAIAQGKKLGLKTYEEFEDLINKTVKKANEPEPIPDHDFIGNWFARIEDSDPQYRFRRTFLSPVFEEGRYKYFSFKGLPTGVYETGYKSNAGNKSKVYYVVSDQGEMAKIDFSQVEELFPEIKEKEEKTYLKGCLVIEQRLGATNEIVLYEGKHYKVVEVETKTFYEDDDGIISERYPCEANYVNERNFYKTYLLPATLLEIEGFNKMQQNNQLKKEARFKLKEINENLLNNENRISPENTSYPSGVEYVLQQGFYQPNKVLIVGEDKLWSLGYNGGDGDDWSYNNIAGAWIGCYISLSPELRQEILDLIKFSYDQSSSSTD